jgi:hypothetical protein
MIYAFRPRAGSADGSRCPGRAALDEKLAAHLIGKHSENFEAETGAFAGMKVWRQADAVVLMVSSPLSWV